MINNDYFVKSGKRKSLTRKEKKILSFILVVLAFLIIFMVIPKTANFLINTINTIKEYHSILNS